MKRARFAVGAAPDEFARNLFRAASSDPSGAAAFALGVAVCLAPVVTDAREQDAAKVQTVEVQP